MLAFSSATCP
uniref:Uncharacterized protein n=1 Tax=Arundo donax TaxID=35708 RepID=A0A0A9FH38_ARUDO